MAGVAYGAASASAQTPPPVPALPDAPRLTTYNLSGSNCNCAVGFQLYGDGTDVDAWLQVFVGSTPYLSTDPAHGWAITSPTGSLGAIPRPITNAVLTFAMPQSGAVTIVGDRRPRRASQFPENRGVTARDLNQAFTDIVAMSREQWDAVNGTIRGQPGEALTPLPGAAARAGNLLSFDGSGQPVVGAGGFGTGNVQGPASSVNGNIACWNGPTGRILLDCGTIGQTTLTGDVTGGPSVGAIATTLANTAVAPGSYGSTSNSVALTVDAKGRLTAAANAPITPASVGAVPTTRQIFGGAGVSVAGGPSLAADLTVGLSPIPNNTGLCNISGAPLAPANCTMTAFLDAVMGSVQGDLLYRNATQWVALPPGAAGQLLSTGGPAANVNWITASGTGTVTSITQGAGITLSASPCVTTCAASLTAPVTVPLGGTGKTTLTNHALLLGQGAAAAADTGTGAAGQCMVSNGAAADPTYTSGCRVLLATLTAANSATLTDITHITAAYNEYELVFENILPVTNNTGCQITVHSGGSFQSTGYNALVTNNGTASGSLTTNIPCSPLASVSNAHSGVSGQIRIYKPSSGAFPVMWRGQFLDLVAGNVHLAEVGGAWDTAAAIDGFQVQFNTGNIASGTIKIYGMI
jgi:hypothetical protein